MKTIEVVAAIIRKDNRIFATQRGYGPWKDWWEFPGGKMELGEAPEDALVREIEEELSTQISVDKFLHTVDYDYPQFHLTMHCYMCSLLTDALHLNEHEAARWLGVDELRTVNWLPADDQLLPLIERELNARPRRVTPSQIIDLADGEIFVFGSNVRGMHMGGAARFAAEKFGAVWGVGEGLQGRSYAIPTMEGLESLAPAVDRFTIFARQHPELKFYVTTIGCGIAGYRPDQIAPMFQQAASLPNVYLPASFWEVIN